MTGQLTSILNTTSRSLSTSLRALPNAMRPGVSCAYLFCRAADIIAECGELPRRERLDMLGDLAAFAAGGSPAPFLASSVRAAKLPVPSDCVPLSDMGRVINLFAKIPAHEQALCRETLAEFCSGLETDLSYFDAGENGIKAFFTGEELLAYCGKTGGAPALFWTRMCELHGGLRESGELRSVAREIGTAFQLCNILDSLPCDLKRGRCYLPLEDLKVAGITPAQMVSPESAARLRPVLWKWAARTVKLMGRSEQYLCAIDETQPALRMAFCGPAYWCMETLAAVIKKENPHTVPDKPETPRARIRFSITGMPAVLTTDAAYIKGFRLRRETLLAGGPPAALSH